nr:unnamed protein product [Digitaria exilis]
MWRSVTSRLRRACQSGISATQTAGSSRDCVNPRLRSHASMHGRLCVYSGFFFSGSPSSHCASDGSAAASATTHAPLFGRPSARDAGAATPLGRTEGRAGETRARARSELERAMDMDDRRCWLLLLLLTGPARKHWKSSPTTTHTATPSGSQARESSH